MNLDTNVNALSYLAVLVVQICPLLPSGCHALHKITAREYLRGYR